MRLLLDAHVSGRAIGRALEYDGHDVRAVDSEVELEGATDEELLELAASENRVLITFNVGDFRRIAESWREEERPHSGLILVSKGVRHEHFGVVVRGVRVLFERVPEQADWTDRSEWLPKAS